MMGNYNDAMESVLTYIENHLERDEELWGEGLGLSLLTTQQLARIAGYSEYHFIRLFKAHTNMTVTEYVIRRRLLRASEEIANGTRIIDAALKYGWETHSGFTKAFRRAFGFSPSLLRAMYMEVQLLQDNKGGSMMNGVFLETTKIGTTKEELFDILLRKVEAGGIPLEPDALRQVYDGACDAYAGLRRYSGEEYVTHPLNVAILLVEMGAEPDVICAGLYCDALKKGHVSPEPLWDRISGVLPEGTKELIEMVNMEEFNNEEAAEDPVREKAILIKLAERLHNMRTVAYMDEAQRAEKARETIEIFLPLAQRTGNQKIFDELNDLSRKLV